MATEAAWLNGNNLEKEEIKKKKKEKKKKKRLTLTGLLMEGVLHGTNRCWRYDDLNKSGCHLVHEA